MPRRLRVQYEDALYPVINRGNYRLPVFTSVGAARSFETTFGEASEMHGWRIHAHAVMRNHVHLALETPRPNLVEGMHWLESTFATRFNRHVSQGRYQALVAEDAVALRGALHLDRPEIESRKTEYSSLRRQAVAATASCTGLTPYVRPVCQQHR